MLDPLHRAHGTWAGWPAHPPLRRFGLLPKEDTGPPDRPHLTRAVARDHRGSDDRSSLRPTTGRRPDVRLLISCRLINQHTEENTRDDPQPATDPRLAGARERAG